MLRPGFALLTLYLASLSASTVEAQVRDRPARPVTGSPALTQMVRDRENTLARPMAPPTNLTATGTPATASLRWDAAPGATGYYVSRTDAAGATAKLTPTPLAATSFEDRSGGVRPGTGYVYHVTAAYPDGGLGTAELSFTTPAAAVPTELRLEGQGEARKLVWSPVAGAASYVIVESWTQAIPVTVTSPDGRSTTTRTDYYTRTNTYVVTATQQSAPTNGQGIVNHVFAVGAQYPPSGVTAPQSQWPHITVP
jgi:hypothetical protein